MCEKKELNNKELEKVDGGAGEITSNKLKSDHKSEVIIITTATDKGKTGFKPEDVSQMPSDQINND